MIQEIVLYSMLYWVFKTGIFKYYIRQKVYFHVRVFFENIFSVHHSEAERLLVNIQSCLTSICLVSGTVCHYLENGGVKTKT